MKKINVNQICDTYKSVSQIKRMQATISELYGCANSKEFVEYILKPCKALINARIDANYIGAIANIKNAENAILDAIRHAKQDRKFARTASVIGVSLVDASELIKRFYPYVDENGNPLRKVFVYKVDENGNPVTDKNGNRIPIAYQFEPLTITNSNADGVVIRAIKAMQRAEKTEKAFDNIRPVGFRFEI